MCCVKCVACARCVHGVCVSNCVALCRIVMRCVVCAGGCNL